MRLMRKAGDKYVISSFSDNVKEENEFSQLVIILNYYLEEATENIRLSLINLIWNRLPL